MHLILSEEKKIRYICHKIGYPYTNKPVTGERGKELAEKYLKKDSSPKHAQPVKMPSWFAVEWRQEIYNKQP